MQFHSENKSSKWNDAIKSETESMLEYKELKKWDKATLDNRNNVMNSPKGYHRIKVHLVLLSSLMADIKLDLWQMAT